MRDATMLDYRYRTRCSCCSDTVTKEALARPDNNDSEGNLCMQCYDEQMLRNWFEWQDAIDIIQDALSPIHALKFRYTKPWYKRYYCDRMMKQGILKWQIG